MKLSTTIQLINLLLALGLLSGCSVKELFSSKQHEMVLIPAGEFMMGDLSCKNTRSTCESKNDEEAYQQCIAEGCVGSPVDRPKHYRRVQQSFLMSKTEITQSQYASLTKRWPSYHDEARDGSVPEVSDVVVLDQGFTFSDGKPGCIVYGINEEGKYRYEAEVYESELGHDSHS